MEAEEKQRWQHSMNFDKSNIPTHAHVIDKQTSNNIFNVF